MLAQAKHPLLESGAPERPLIKSRHRVKAFGEVNTPPHMVKTMLDLVSDDLGIVDRTFLEPAAGDGNFLTAILRRKLQAIERRFRDERLAQESLFALASIYGIELLEDNHADAQAALLEVLADFCDRHAIGFGRRTNSRQAAELLISANILRGNTLTAEAQAGGPLVFSWWHRVANLPGKVRRVPFTFASLRAAPPAPKAPQVESLFDLPTDTAEPADPVLPAYAVCRIDQVHKEVTTQ
ncbi:MAG: hypothetical protein FWG11_02905 [Promicromonosporaceae bacterium]|nr:hypothetical protein [Promicromonosporaceae bacterium]